jgi:negative regulator of sigma E activity
MNDPASDRSDPDFERQLRATFDESLGRLDAQTLSRLNQSRQKAVEAAQHRPLWSGRSGWTTWAPLGALAAGVLVAVVVWRMPGEPQAPVTARTVVAPTVPAEGPAPEPLELLTSGEDLELAAAADLDFYAWVELATADATDGVG